MSRTYLTDVLTPRQLAFIAERLPEPPNAPTGRPHYTNHERLPGILRVLRSRCRWRDLDQPGHPSGVTHWRRLRYRVDRTATAFACFVYVAILVLCVRRAVGDERGRQRRRT